MPASSRQPQIVALSSSLLTERMLLYSSFLPAIHSCARLTVWTTAERTAQHDAIAQTYPVEIEPFPATLPFKQFPYNYLRRLNEYAWDYSLNAPSRRSLRQHLEDKTTPWSVRLLEYPGRALGQLGLAQSLEDSMEKLLHHYPRSPEATQRLTQKRPDFLFTMGTFRYEEPAVAAAAYALKIPRLAFITSWDNPSTKRRMVFNYDGYIVWSQEMKDQMHYFFPHSRCVPIYVVGAPQFDVFFQPGFEQARQEFCQENQLDPAHPIILYAMGSPNMIPEMTAVRYLAQRVAQGELGSAQLLVRPHPIHDKSLEFEALRDLRPKVVVQSTGQVDLNVQHRAQDESLIRQWVNTFRHCAVVVNLSSTAAIDGALFDKPVVNLDFDPEPTKKLEPMIKEINHLWTHFKPVAESGGLWLVNNPSEMVEAVRAYLKQPELHREDRRKMAVFVVSYLDGNSGKRLAEALLDFSKNPHP